MKFLGGFLKFLSVLLMLIGTAAGTVLVILGVTEDIIEPILVGVGVFLAFLFVALGVMGTGIALVQSLKLKKQVEQLEQRLWTVSAAAPVSAPAPVIAPESTPEPAVEPIAEALTSSAPKKAGIRWLPVIIGAALVVIAILVVSFAGVNKNHTQPVMEESKEQQAVELPPVEMSETEATEAPIIERAELSIGSSLETGFVYMTFDEVVVQDDIKKSVTIDRVTHTTGPEPLPGQVYICLSGTIKNTTTSELPVYDFFAGRFQIGDYEYDVSANDCDVLDADGTSESTIAPLMEYEYRIYTAIPAELQEFIAAGEPFSFTFGFYDNFDNQELAYNRSFEDDAIALCPYQFFIPFA